MATSSAGDESGEGKGQSGEAGEERDVSLSELYRRGVRGHREIESGTMASSTEDFKAHVVAAVRDLEGAWRMAQSLGLFSRNETLEEVATADLQYLLLPALLGDLILQQPAQAEQAKQARLTRLHEAHAALTDYLAWCHCYGLSSEPPPTHSFSEDTPSSSSAPSSLERMAGQRSARIARFKQQRAREAKVKELSLRLAAEGGAEEELRREHLVAQLALWVYKCQELVRSVDSEAELLINMERSAGQGRGGKTLKEEGCTQPTARPLPSKPFVITREMLKAKVYGAGYPSVPSISLEEFYQQEYSKQQATKQRLTEPCLPSKGEEEKEEEGEEEEEESLKKAREFDEYKDEHRRGTGNRKNMG